MFQSDSSGFPLVKHRFFEGSTAADADAFFESLKALLQAEKPFCLLVETDGQSPFAPEAKKSLNQFLRSHRSALKSHCKGLVRVVPEVGRMGRYLSVAISLSMPFPLRVCASWSEAEAEGLRLLGIR